MNRKIFWLLAFIATGLGLMFSALNQEYEMLTGIVLIPVMVFYILGLRSHYRELRK